MKYSICILGYYRERERESGEDMKYSVEGEEGRVHEFLDSKYEEEVELC